MRVLSDGCIMVLWSSTSDCVLSWLRRAELVTIGKWMRHAWTCGPECSSQCTVLYGMRK